MATRTYEYVGYDPSTLYDSFGTDVTVGEVKAILPLLANLNARITVTYTNSATSSLDTYFARHGWQPI